MSHKDIKSLLVSGPVWMSQVRTSLDCSDLLLGPGLEPVAGR